MGFFSCTSKFILFVFNLIVVVLSLAVLGLGVYGYVQTSSYGGLLTPGAITFIVIGSVVTLIAFLGCWGAIQENRCYLHLYASILLILLLALIAIGAYIIIKKSDAERHIVSFVDNEFEKVRDGDALAKDAVDTIQKSFECCGSYGPSFWSNSGLSFPASCCKNKPNGPYCARSDVYQQGCEPVLKRSIIKHLNLTGTFGIVVGCVELLGVIFAFILSNSIKRQSLRSHI